MARSVVCNINVTIAGLWTLARNKGQELEENTPGGIHLALLTDLKKNNTT